MCSQFRVEETNPHLDAPLLNMEPMEVSAGGQGFARLDGVEIQLQKLLLSERMKSQTHKTHYDKIKADYDGLQLEFSELQDELERVMSEKKSQQEKKQLMINQLERELLEKNVELEELQLHVLTPQRLELIRGQVQQDMEAPFREIFNRLEEETDRYKSENNQLKLELMQLKSQFDFQKEEFTRTLEGKKIFCDAEISCLKSDLHDLVTQYQDSGLQHDARQVEALLRDKAQLQQKLKDLEAEVAEIRAQKSDSDQKAESIQHIQNRQLTEIQATVKSLETERQSLRLQLERMENELRLATEQNNQQFAQLHKAEKEVNRLTTLNVYLTKLQTDVEKLKAAEDRYREMLVEKEKEVMSRVQSAREEEFAKILALRDEKVEVENRLAALEQQKMLQEAASSIEKKELVARFQRAQQGEESSRHELESLRKQQSSQKVEISDLQQQVQALNVKLGNVSQCERDLTEKNQQLGEALGRVQEELKTTQVQAESSQREADRQEKKYRTAKEKLQRAAEAQKKRKLLTETKENRQQEKIQIQEAKIKELELEASLAKKRLLLLEEEPQANRHLKELQRRHQEFRSLLFDCQDPYTSLPACPTMLLPAVTGQHPSEDLSLLHRRLEDLENSQQQQLQKLVSMEQSKQDDTAATLT